MLTNPIRKIDIDKEMQQAYLDYAMSVIVSRALPDARDGLKPVHRRILYAMYDMGLRPETSYKKSARVVGEVLGKYHPHSDQAVYDAMARMAQDFSLRLPLVDGQGNFGSVDGDPPAAMRYTEAKLTLAAQELLNDLKKNTVDHSDNFDASLQEPDVLPAAIPNLLVNGATGIAVGMSTNIPPHNLGEVVDALKEMLANWKKVDDIHVDDLMKHIKGPDFPTGGIILEGKNEEGLASAYGSGRGKVKMQAKARIESIGRGREHILVTEIPYMVNKSALIERIANLARSGTIEGITDLRDESDRQGMRIVIEVSKSVQAKKVLQNLFKRTQMQSTFGIIMLALVNGEPRLLSLKQALKVFLEHRLEIIERRSQFDLEKAEARAHLLEGYQVALKNLDEVIQIIRKSSDVENAREKLMNRFELSEIQANAILNMPLKNLADLERKKIESEYKEILVRIKSLNNLLASPTKMRKVVADELDSVKEKYADKRRTLIVKAGSGAEKQSMLTAGDLTEEKDVWVAVSVSGKIARLPGNKVPRASGKDAPIALAKVSSRDTLMIIADNGKAAAIAVHAIPEAGSLAGGEMLSRVSSLKPSEKVIALFGLPALDKRGPAYIISVSRSGMVKRTLITELPGPISQSFRMAKVKKDDALIAAWLSKGNTDLLIVSSSGKAIRFAEDEVRATGLLSTGVNGIKLKKGDIVSGALSINSKEDLFFMLSDGQAKRIKVSQFPKQGRYGQGVTAWKLIGQQKLVGVGNQKGTVKASIILDKLSPKSSRLDAISAVGRQAGGKQIVELKKEDAVIAMVVPGSNPPDNVIINQKRKQNRKKKKNTEKQKKLL